MIIIQLKHKQAISYNISTEKNQKKKNYFNRLKNNNYWQWHTNTLTHTLHGIVLSVILVCANMVAKKPNQTKH